MVRRKSQKQNNHNPLTYQEARSTLGHYGTQKSRVGADSQLPFGHCALSLNPITRDAVVSPSGTLYQKESIVEYLVRENEKLKEWRQSYERQQVEDEEKEKEEEGKKKMREIESFSAKDGGVLTSADASAHVSKHASGRLGSLKGMGYDVSGREEKKAGLKRTSYWLSDWTPDAGEERVKTPPKRPSSPFSGREIRLKDLKAVTLCTEESGPGGAGSAPVFVCALSRKRMSTQPCVAITRTGTVMLKASYEEFARGDMVDPVAGGKFKEKDVVDLRKAATGYAASGKVEAEVYRPTMS